MLDRGCASSTGWLTQAPMTSSKLESGRLKHGPRLIFNASVHTGAGEALALSRATRWRARLNWNCIVKILSATLIAVFTIGFGWILGLDRHDHVVGVSVEATELWRNPWPAPGERD